MNQTVNLIHYKIQSSVRKKEKKEKKKRGKILVFINSYFID